MKNHNSTEYYWNEQFGLAECHIYYNGLIFHGMANCSPEDIIHKSQTFGEQLAELRATREYLAHVRDYEILPQLKALEQLYYSMKHSKYFNPKSYEAKMLFRQIRQRKEDKLNIKQLIEGSRRQEKYMISQLERTKNKLKEKEGR